MEGSTIAFSPEISRASTSVTLRNAWAMQEGIAKRVSGIGSLNSAIEWAENGEGIWLTNTGVDCGT